VNESFKSILYEGAFFIVSVLRLGWDSGGTFLELNWDYVGTDIKPDFPRQRQRRLLRLSLMLYPRNSRKRVRFSLLVSELSRLPREQLVRARTL